MTPQATVLEIAPVLAGLSGERWLSGKRWARHHRGTEPVFRAAAASPAGARAG